MDVVKYSPYVFGVLSLLFLRRFYTIIYNLFFSPLKQFPGPFWWSVSALPFTRSTVSGGKHKDLERLHKQYGPVVRVAPNELSYTNSVVWKDAWAYRQGHAEFIKAFTAKPVNDVQGILLAKRDDHARFRRLLSHAFSAHGLGEQEPRIQHYVDLLVRGWETRSTIKTGEPLDMVAWFNWTTFDLIGDLAFGESFGCLETMQTHPWIAGIFGNLASSVFFTALRDYHLTLLLLFLVPKRLLRLRLENYKYTSEKMARRMQFGKDRGDFFDNVLKHGDPEKVVDGTVGRGMTLKELESNASQLVLAGSETTATLLSGTIFQLLTNPNVMKKVVEEVRSRFSSADEITITSTGQLRYLLAVLEEAMRIYPPVPTFSGRVVPEPGDTVDGIWLPAGTVVHMPQVVAYNLESNFARPNEFIPERWLENRNTEFEHDDRKGVFQPFSVGPRNCIGRNLAYAEMRLIMAKLLWTFDLAVPSDQALTNKGLGGGQAQWVQWVKRQKTFILWEKESLWVDVKERQ